MKSKKEETPEVSRLNSIIQRQGDKLGKLEDQLSSLLHEIELEKRHSARLERIIDSLISKKEK